MKMIIEIINKLIIYDINKLNFKSYFLQYK